MKFLYVVDHPSRDLPSYAWWSIASGFHSPSDIVALISMNDISRDVLVGIPADVIIWNYARPNNISLIRDSYRLGIYNIVHDTEGIPYDISSYFSSLSSSDFRFIHEIWTWGDLQLQHLRSRFVTEKVSTLLRNTGSIRYSYAAQLPKVKLSANKVALWNTNFPLLSPKFSSFEQEFSDLHNKHRYPLATALELVRVASECRIFAIYKCINILASIPDLSLVLRTHPFEAKHYYIAYMNDHRLALSSDGDVNHDISSCSFVLHSGCQTALDAYFRGVPSFVFSHSNASIWTSISCVLPQDLCRLIDPDFLSSSLHRQRELFTEYKLDLLLSNLSDGYNYLHSFALTGLVSPSKKYLYFWSAYYRIRRIIGLFLRLSSWPRLRACSPDYRPPAKKLTAMDIAAYLDKHFKAPSSIINNCVFIHLSR